MSIKQTEQTMEVTTKLHEFRDEPLQFVSNLANIVKFL